MKKGIIAMATVVALGLGLAAVNSQARGWDCDGSGYGGGYGYGMMHNRNVPAAVDTEKLEKFRTEAAPIRKAIAMDQAERNAILAGTNPDPSRVRELTGTIADNREKLAKLAEDYGIEAPGPGFGDHHNGPGYGRHGGPMGRHMYGGPRGGGFGNCNGPGNNF